MRDSSKAVLGALMLLFVAAGTADASWPTSGRRLSDNDISNQTNAVIAPDGQGGAYVAWSNETEDATNPSIQDVYLQHVTATGDIAPGWPTLGIPLETAPGLQALPVIAADGTGGALVVWPDERDAGTTGIDLYGIRVNANGSLASGWPAGGLAICRAPGAQQNPSIVPDGAGGALFTWEDYRYQGYLAEPFGVRVSADGSVASGWPLDGKRLIGDGNADGCTAARDGAGGALLETFYSGGQRLLRMDLDGVPVTGWPADGVLFLPSSATQTAFDPRWCPDGSGGIFYFWADYRTMPPPFDPYTFYDYLDIYGVHVHGDGSLDAGWPTAGLPLCTAATSQDVPDAMPDGQGGVFVVWEDQRNQHNGDIYGLHLNGDGTRVPGWSFNGSAVIVGPGYDAIAKMQPYPTRLAPDGSGGLWECSWDKFGNQYSRVQHVNGDGSLASGFTTAGKPVPDTGYPGQTEIVITSDGFGNAIVCFASGGYLYAQRVGDNVVTAIALTLVASEAYPDHVRLSWQAPQTMRATLERREGAGDWRDLGEVVTDGEYRLSYDDRDVAGGRSYTYRLRYVEGAATEYGAETTIEVPARYALGLQGARPNPARASDGTIAFTLADGAPARLELLDVTGRQLLSRDVGAMGAGPHVVRLAEAGPLAAGLYWARLATAERTLTARIAVTH